VTPYEAWFGLRPNASHYRVWGSPCWVHRPKEVRKKLEKKAIQGVFMGYERSTRIYRIWDPNTGTIRIARSVTFNERSLQTRREQREIEIQGDIDHGVTTVSEDESDGATKKAVDETRDIASVQLESRSRDIASVQPESRSRDIASVQPESRSRDIASVQPESRSRDIAFVQPESRSRDTASIQPENRPSSPVSDTGREEAHKIPNRVLREQESAPESPRQSPNRQLLNQEILEEETEVRQRQSLTRAQRKEKQAAENAARREQETAAGLQRSKRETKLTSKAIEQQDKPEKPGIGRATALTVMPAERGETVMISLTYQEALAGPQAGLWKEAIEQELQSIYRIRRGF
jgi:hypothetical protein